MIEARNPVRLESGDIDLEWNHPSLGWIPFTASPDDPETHGREIYALADAGEFGAVEEFDDA